MAIVNISYTYFFVENGKARPSAQEDQIEK